jgi:hypothetical protein
MGEFVRSQNVKRYSRLLERVTDESDRRQIINLLAEGRQKQKDAGVKGRGQRAAFKTPIGRATYRREAQI